MNDQSTSHGAFSWCELATPNLEESINFYTELLGWEIEGIKLQAGMTYNVVKAQGNPIGGMMAMPPQTPQGTPAMWGSFITVDDVEAVAQKAGKIGAKIVVPVIDIPEIGKFCFIQDPQGAIFAIINYANK